MRYSEAISVSHSVFCIVPIAAIDPPEASSWLAEENPDEDDPEILPCLPAGETAREGAPQPRPSLLPRALHLRALVAPLAAPSGRSRPRLLPLRLLRPCGTLSPPHSPTAKRTPESLAMPVPTTVAVV